MKDYNISTNGFNNTVTIGGSVGRILLNAVRKGGSLKIKEDGKGFTIQPTYSFNAKVKAARDFLNRYYLKRNVFFHEGHQVTFCSIHLDGHTYVGYAICAPGDTYHSDIGRAIALMRALDLTIPEIFLS